MTGRLVVRAADEPAPPHTHVYFELDDGRELRYTDIRRFGRMLLLPDAKLAALRERLGEDAAGRFPRRSSAGGLAGRRARIKALLLDQSVLRGVGNIYADESLWRARMHPARLAAKLTQGGASTGCGKPCSACCATPSGCAARPFPTSSIPTGSPAATRSGIASTPARASPAIAAVRSSGA